MKITLATNKMINVYITYEIKSWLPYIGNSFTLKNSLFEAVELTKNGNINKYSYSEFVLSFCVRENFSLLNGRFGRT